MPRNRRHNVNLPCVFEEVKCRTDRFSYSFFPDAISTWNHTIGLFETMPTLAELKNHLTSLIRPKEKPVYGYFEPLHLRYIFQLRVGLSKLRYHKNRHNFVDTPSDVCLCKTGVEDTRHYLLSCPFCIIVTGKI